MNQIPLPIGPLPQPSFESFLPGPNGAALAHLSAMALPAAPVYLWGAAGSGKTHLLQALVRQCQAAGQVVGWFEAGRSLPWTMSAEWSAVVVDRCDLLNGAEQHAVFALFVDAASFGVQVVAAGRLPPVDLPLRDDVRSRLAWGHVFALQTLAETETRAALRREADRRGIFLSDEVMAYLLTRFARDLGHLMHLLDRLDEFALSKARHVTVPLLRQMLAEQGLDVVQTA
jgi:DnaA-homolog protein